MKNRKQNNSTLFISDIHLNQKTPEVTKSFITFVQTKACQSQALYILGDLFEYWLGDDVNDVLAETVATALTELSNSGTKIYYMHGNRDFLIGENYAKKSGFEILPDPTIHKIHNQRWILTHGDSLCTDDYEYQKIKKIIRTPEWQNDFLEKSVEQRIEFAEKARQKSQKHTLLADQKIMDVNPIAVKNMFNENNISYCIHGHTHRPAIHSHNSHIRAVLADWHLCANYLEINDHGFSFVHGPAH